MELLPPLFLMLHWVSAPDSMEMPGRGLLLLNRRELWELGSSSQGSRTPPPKVLVTGLARQVWHYLTSQESGTHLAPLKVTVNLTS